MTTAPAPAALTTELRRLGRDLHAIRENHLPAIGRGVWELALRYGVVEPELIDLTEELDALSADIQVHLEEEERPIAGELTDLVDHRPFDDERLDRLELSLDRLARRHDDLRGEIEAMRQTLLGAELPASAEDDRCELLDRLGDLATALTDHDRREVDVVIPAARADIHRHRVAGALAEDRARGWA